MSNALRRLPRRPPSNTSSDLEYLFQGLGGSTLAAIDADGTTNALALAKIDLFAPVYGPGSAARFAALAPSRIVDSPNLMDDVDTFADLERLVGRLGPQTRSVLAAAREAAAA